MILFTSISSNPKEKNIFLSKDITTIWHMFGGIEISRDTCYALCKMNKAHAVKTRTVKDSTKIITKSVDGRGAREENVCTRKTHLINSLVY